MPNQYEFESIGIGAYEMAEEIFEICGVRHDFCHQTGLVFGSTNRIKLTTRGWVAEESHCTEKFLAAFKEHNNVT